MPTRKPSKPSKKKAPKTEKRDFSQVALSIVEQVTGDRLTGADSTKPLRRR
jgi:hypothetical protein